MGLEKPTGPGLSYPQTNDKNKLDRRTAQAAGAIGRHEPVIEQEMNRP